MVLGGDKGPEAIVEVLQGVNFGEAFHLKGRDEVNPLELSCAYLLLGVHIVIHRFDYIEHLQ